jgi:hypothetical protein
MLREAQNSYCLCKLRLSHWAEAILSTLRRNIIFRGDFCGAHLICRREWTFSSTLFANHCSVLCGRSCVFRIKQRVKLSYTHCKKKSFCTVYPEMLAWVRVLGELFLTHITRKRAVLFMRTLIRLSRLERLLKLFLHTFHEKDRPRHLNCRAALRLWVNNVIHVSQQDIFSLLLPILAYTSLVRPILEYGAACWDPYRKGDTCARPGTKRSG